ncbi:MAG: LysR family transcriptional regulator [Propionibacteriales bacterium]|nr:LysR family transcriptional regulator [Propionibacteriales bacterium]
MTRHWPDLAVLDLLVAVSEHGGLSAAARAVGMAQPNASRALTRLEAHLGLILLRRSHTGSTLTDEGIVVVDWARQVLTAADRLLIGTEALHARHRSEVSIAASMTIAEHLLPAWLTELRRQQPETRISVAVHNSDEVFSRVRDRSCPIGFVESPRIPKGLQSLTVARDRLVVVVASDHPWARRRRPLSAQELAATPLVVREEGSGTRSTLESVLARHERVPPTLELTSNTAVRAGVASGAGPAVLSVLSVHTALRSGELRAVPVADLDLQRRMRAVWLPPTRPDGAADDLVRIAQRLGAEQH